MTEEEKLNVQISEVVGDVTIEISSARIDASIEKARKLLAEQVISDCDQYIPVNSGALRSSVRITDETGQDSENGNIIMYDKQYAHYQYVGTVYAPSYPILDKEGNIVSWWSPPNKYPTDRKLEYHTEGTQDHWFEVAKAENIGRWTDIVKQNIAK